MTTPTPITTLGIEGFDTDGLRGFVSDAHALLALTSKAVTEKVHDLLPVRYHFVAANLTQHGRYEVTYEVDFRRVLVLTVPLRGEEPFFAHAIDLAVPSGVSPRVSGDSPRSALLALAKAAPLFASWRGC
jgi:hypothetical protein